MESPEPALRVAWAPFAYGIFRMLWMASFVSNLGTLMHNTGAAWLMTTLSPSPTLTALVQTATNLPVFLLALPAGALADILDRRRLLLVTQSWMLAAAALLALCSFLEVTTPSLLLGLTFALGLGAALNAPAWQAIVPELVPRPQLASAVALNSAGFNAARAIGPALGGLVVAEAGPAATFALNAASFLGVILVLFRWKRRATQHSVLPAERVLGAMSTGLRYTRHAPILRAVLWRSGSFVLFGSGIWALLPMLARRELELGPAGYGILLGFLGAGAVIGVLVLPMIRPRLALDTLLRGAVLVFAGATFVAAFVREFAAVAAAMLVGGVAWLTLLATFNANVQASVPAWVRGRALSVYLLVTFGALGGGSALWGAVADKAGIPWALAASGIGIVAGLLLTLRFRIGQPALSDLEPSLHWPAPRAEAPIDPDEGPVVVTIEYRVPAERFDEFARALGALRVVRLRDGALSWQLLRDTEDPMRCVESFMLESWTEHLRQHERITIADREVEARARSFHVGPEPPRVTHFVAEAMRR